MVVDTLEFNLFGENTYILYDPKTREAAVVDPGMMNQRECAAFDNYIERIGVKIKYLINTHLHIDHVAGDAYISEKYGVPLIASAKDAFLAERIVEQAMTFRLNVNVNNVTIEQEVNEGDVLYLGKEKLEILEVPGHSPGSIALYAPESQFVIVGDALFKMSIGRTDLPGGNYATLIDSITKKLLSLPGETTVYSGHGQPTTIETERLMNPYLAR